MNISYMDEIDIFQRSSDQVDEDRSTSLFRFRLVFGENVRSIRSKGQVKKFQQSDSYIESFGVMENRLSGIFSRTYVIGNVPENPERSSRSKH